MCDHVNMNDLGCDSDLSNMILAVSSYRTKESRLTGILSLSAQHIEHQHPSYRQFCCCQKLIMADVHYIVSKLNAPPYNLGVSLLTFRSAQLVLGPFLGL
jgi:hypothetical protein